MLELRNVADLEWNLTVTEAENLFTSETLTLSLPQGTITSIMLIAFKLWFYNIFTETAFKWVLRTSPTKSTDVVLSEWGLC